MPDALFCSNIHSYTVQAGIVQAQTEVDAYSSGDKKVQEHQGDDGELEDY